jgi:excisionase family DNA binding protein
MDNSPITDALGAAASATLVVVDAERLADALAARLGRTPATGRADDWLDVEAAAQHLSCPVSRIYDLKATGRLRYAKDGTRLLFKRAWLDDAVQTHDPTRS